MSEDSLTLYKLMILFMLDNLDFPLTNSQLSEFFRTTNYRLTSGGKEALSMFETQIPAPIKNDIMDYFAEKKYQLRREVDITADYYPVKKGEYMVKTQIREKGVLLLELQLNVVSKEQAIAVCDKWRDKSDAVYGKIMEILLLEE